MARDTHVPMGPLGEVMRAAGVPNGYEHLKEFSRGRAIDAASLRVLIDSLPLAPADKARLQSLSPAGYAGLAARLALEV